MKSIWLSQGALLILAFGPVRWGRCTEHEEISRAPISCLREHVIVHKTFTVTLDSTPASG